MSSISQSREHFPIINGTLRQLFLAYAAEKVSWEKKDKEAIVAILAIIDSFHIVRLVRNREFHKRRSKHIDAVFHLIREFHMVTFLSLVFLHVFSCWIFLPRP